MNAREDWLKAIPGFEGFYSATTAGEIFSHHSKRFLKATISKRGYAFVDLYKSGVRHMRTVHSLVADTFIERSAGKNCVNHKDFDTSNNSVTNLEWVTQAENLNYSRRHGRMPVTDRQREMCRIAQIIQVQQRRAQNELTR